MKLEHIFVFSLSPGIWLMLLRGSIVQQWRGGPDRQFQSQIFSLTSYVTITLFPCASAPHLEKSKDTNKRTYLTVLLEGHMI